MFPIDCGGPKTKSAVNLVVVNSEWVGVGGVRFSVDEAGRVADEAAAGDVDRRVGRGVVDQQAGAGVHRSVPDERAVCDGGGRERAEERDSALVALEPRRGDARRDAWWHGRLVADMYDQCRFVQVHHCFYRTLVHLYSIRQTHNPSLNYPLGQ